MEDKKFSIVITVRAEEPGDTFNKAKYFSEECELDVHTVLDTSHAIFGTCSQAVYALLTAHPDIVKIEENES